MRTLGSAGLQTTGSCLGALTRLLASRPAAFAGFDLPTSNYNSPLANAGYVFSLLHSFLITHAHWGECTCTARQPRARQLTSETMLKQIIYLYDISRLLPTSLAELSTGPCPGFRIGRSAKVGVRLATDAAEFGSSYEWWTMACPWFIRQGQERTLHMANVRIALSKGECLLTCLRHVLLSRPLCQRAEWMPHRK